MVQRPFYLRLTKILARQNRQISVIFVSSFCHIAPLAPLSAYRETNRAGIVDKKSDAQIAANQAQFPNNADSSIGNNGDGTNVTIDMDNHHADFSNR